MLSVSRQYHPFILQVMSKNGKLHFDMRFFLCSALLLHFVLCSDSPAASSPSEHKVQIQLHKYKKSTSTTYLEPLELISRELFPELLHYGFILNTKRKTLKLVVRNQTLDIPMNAKALLMTLPRREGVRVQG